VESSYWLPYWGYVTVAQADPPALIRVVRNVPAVGAIQPYVDGKAVAVVLGLRSVSGLQETWLTELHDSFASMRISTGRYVGPIDGRAKPSPRTTISSPRLAQ